MDNLRYFRTYTGYSKPLTPRGEFAFKETATVPTYYIGWFGENGRLTRFQKIAVSRKDTRRFKLSSAVKPGTVLYFAVRDTLAEPITWDALTYDKTKQFGEYYEGRVDDSGLGGDAVRFERKAAFTEVYEPLSESDANVSPALYESASPSLNLNLRADPKTAQSPNS